MLALKPFNFTMPEAYNFSCDLYMIPVAHFEEGDNGVTVRFCVIQIFIHVSTILLLFRSINLIVF